MLNNFKELFKILGFKGTITDNGKTLKLTYIGDNDLGVYKFLKIRDAFEVSSNGLINEVGYLYNFITFDDNLFMVSQVSYEDLDG